MPTKDDNELLNEQIEEQIDAQSADDASQVIATRQMPAPGAYVPATSTRVDRAAVTRTTGGNVAAPGSTVVGAASSDVRPQQTVATQTPPAPEIKTETPEPTISQSELDSEMAQGDGGTSGKPVGKMERVEPVTAPLANPTAGVKLPGGELLNPDLATPEELASRRGESAAPTDRYGGKGFYDWAVKYLQRYRPLSDKELEAEARREKRKALFATLGDGVSALSNLIFATQGAPSSHDPQTTMSAVQRARRDKLIGDRKEHEQWYMTQLSKIRQLEQADEKEARLERQAEAKAENARALTAARSMQMEAEAAYKRALTSQKESEADKAAAESAYWQEVYRLLLENGNLSLKDAKTAAKLLSPDRTTYSYTTSRGPKGTSEKSTTTTTTSGGSSGATSGGNQPKTWY